MKKRTTIMIDEDIIRTAKEYSNVKETTTVIHDALKEYIQHRAMQRLVALGGSDPTAKAPPRRRHKW